VNRFISLLYRSIALSLALVVALGIQNATFASPQEAAAKEAAAKDQPETVSPRRGPIRSEVTVPGILFSQRTAEIAVSPQTTQAFKVLSAVPHGTKVKAGDVLVEFDTQSFQDQLADAERALQAAEVAAKEIQREMEMFLEQHPIDVEQAELTWTQAQEDYKYFTEVDFPFDFKELDQSLKSAKDFLDYNHEELKQLEKMYKADDLTEESEEIVLRRARDDFERSKFGFERTKQSSDRQREVGLPRLEKQKKTAHRLAELAYQRSRLELSLAEAKKRQAADKVKVTLEKAAREFGELQADAELFRAVAPIDGIVYHGRCVDGKWPGITEAGNKLRKHGAVLPNEIFMTVVDNSALAATANVPEAELAKVKVGQFAKMTPTAFSDSRVALKVSKIASLPNTDGSFETEYEVVPNGQLQLVAGLNGSIKILIDDQPNALLVPAKAVLTDETDDSIKYVKVLKADGSSARVDVKLGATKGDDVELVGSTLTPNDKLLLK
jgi:multidrug efflux pump subunit AcrA (membrane-fusion protein)